MKFICLYTSANEPGVIKRTTNSHEISISSLSQQYAQDIEQGYHSLLCHYALIQISQLHLQTMNLLLERDDASVSGSSLGSKSMGSDSDISESCSVTSDNPKAAKKEANPTLIGRLVVNNINVQHFMRKVVFHSSKAIVLTASTLICQLAKKILGIKVVAYDSAFCQESGIFFAIDQTKWALPKEEHKKGDFTS